MRKVSVVLLAIAGTASAAPPPLPTSLDAAPTVKLGMPLAEFMKLRPGPQDDRDDVRWFTLPGTDASVRFAFRANQLVYAEADYDAPFVSAHPFPQFIAPWIMTLGLPKTWKDVSGLDGVQAGPLTDSVAWSDGKTFFSAGRVRTDYVIAIGQLADVTVLTPAAGVPAAEFALAMQVIGDMAEIADKDKGNCDLMADELSKYMDSRMADLKHFKSLKTAGLKPTPEQMQQLQAPMMRMMPAMMSCQSSAKMQELGKKMSSM